MVMQLPKQAIDEFREAWRQSFGEDLTDDQAEMEATRLLTLCGVLLDSQQDKKNIKEGVEDLLFGAFVKEPSPFFFRPTFSLFREVGRE